jgi:hypothetical protein
MRAPHKSDPFEPVDHRCHCARGEAGVFRKLSCRRRAREKEQVQAFQIGGVEAHMVRHGVAEQHRLCADTTQEAIERLEQFRTRQFRAGHNSLYCQVSLT